MENIDFMRNAATVLVSFSLSLGCLAQNNDSVVLRQIFTEELMRGQCYQNLDYLSNKIGGRLSGSPQAQKAVDWAFAAMKAAGADTVFKQECMVPHWVRGSKEAGQIRDAQGAGSSENVNICALGGSIGTPSSGILAPVIEVKSIAELYTLGTDKIKGKIVFFNRPFDNSLIDPFQAYGKAVDQRSKGPSVAAKFGAVATICRSMTNGINDFPHTGAMDYADSIPQKIPACAISTLGAEKLSSLLKKNPGSLRFYLKMDCRTLPDERSYNVVAEIKGTGVPEKFIVVGGHLDSWETGDGAQDDGAGVVQAMDIIRIMKTLGIRPKYTIRAVAFMNEENGARGGKKYAELAQKNNETHLLAIETDRGGFSPRGFSLTGTSDQRQLLMKWKPLFEPYGIYDFSHQGGGTDIEPMGKMGVTMMELIPDPQRYFDHHHCPNDNFKGVNQRELEMGAAGLASLIYLASEYDL